jgi:hypothetical protein
MKLTRKQELALIEFGMGQLLNQLIPIKIKKDKAPSKRTWSDARRKKFAKTMAKVWAKKREHGKTV